MRTPAKSTRRLANLSFSSSTIRSSAIALALALIASLSPVRPPALVSNAQSAQQAEVDQPRARSNAWISDQRSRKGYRVADLTDASGSGVSRADASRSDANSTQQTDSIEYVKSHGQFA